MPNIHSQPRFSASQARTRFAELVKTAQETPVEITSDDSPVAVVLGHARFAQLSAQATQAEAALRDISAMHGGTPEAQLAQMQQRVHSVLAAHFPKPKLTLADILARVDGPIPVDYTFMNDGRVGKEVF
jgi:prevent-host-death family protein